MNTVKSHSC